MSRSYRAVNYTIRPAKSVERKILVEAFAELANFDLLTNYIYIGFGSVFFTDFVLFHQRLGFEEMYSIEKVVGDEARVRFNVPYACIDVRMGESNVRLPELPLREKRSVVWLDYDGRLSESVLNDVRSFVRGAASGSALVVPVNVEPDEIVPEGDIDGARVGAFARRFERTSLPFDLSGGHLDGESLPNTYVRVLGMAVDGAVRARNAGVRHLEDIRMHPIMRVEYSDGAKMLTMGWVLVIGAEESRFASCNFERLGLGKPSVPRTIRVPNVTLREARALDAQLPGADWKAITSPPLPEREREEYAKIYRYYPVFGESELG